MADHRLDGAHRESAPVYRNNFVARVSVLSFMTVEVPWKQVAYFVLCHSRVFNRLCHGAGGLLSRRIEAHAVIASQVEP